MTEIRIPTPENISPSELERHFTKHLDALQKSMDLDLSHIDSRATVNDVTITDIQYDEQGCVIEYDVYYSIYNGCKDMDVNDDFDGHICGEIDGDMIVFKKFAPPPKRTTVDEF